LLSQDNVMPLIIGYSEEIFLPDLAFPKSENT